MTKGKIDINDYYKDKYKRMGCAVYLIPILALPVLADEIKFQFKSPSFSGIGTSQHYLTIDEQEYTRREALEAEIKAMQDELERDAQNTTLARFLRRTLSHVFMLNYLDSWLINFSVKIQRQRVRLLCLIVSSLGLPMALRLQ